MAATTEQSSVPRGEKFCVINAPIKGHHGYQTDCPVATRFQCSRTQGTDILSDTAVVVEKADSIVGHVPEGLCQSFFSILGTFPAVSPLVCLVGLPRAPGLLVVG